MHRWIWEAWLSSSQGCERKQQVDLSSACGSGKGSRERWPLIGREAKAPWSLWRQVENLHLYPKSNSKIIYVNICIIYVYIVCMVCVCMCVWGVWVLVCACMWCVQVCVCDVHMGVWICGEVCECRYVNVVAHTWTSEDSFARQSSPIFLRQCLSPFAAVYMGLAGYPTHWLLLSSLTIQF